MAPRRACSHPISDPGLALKQLKFLLQQPLKEAELYETRRLGLW